VTKLVQIAVAGDVAEGEQLQELLTTAGIESQLEPAVEHHESALEDAPLKVLVSETDVEDARDAIEALTEPEEEPEP
jgi:Putative prokaryotic signal transducing protein